jgi:hypothetical protein
MLTGFCFIMGRHHLRSLNLETISGLLHFVDYFYIWIKGVSTLEGVSNEEKENLLRTELPRLCDKIQFRNAAQIEYSGSIGENVSYFLPYWTPRYMSVTKFFRTKKAYFGYSGLQIQSGDKVFVLPGAANPFLLRQKGGAYEVVDYCFVNGMMFGEMVDMHLKGHIPMEKIVII